MNRICSTIRSKMHTLSTNFLSSTVTVPMNNQRGEGFLDVAIKVLIVVVIGIAVLAILNAAVPSLFSTLIARVTAQLTAG